MVRSKGNKKSKTLHAPLPQSVSKPSIPACKPASRKGWGARRRRGLIPSSSPCPPQVSEDLWNKFYEPLIILAAYGKSQGPYFKAPGDEIGSLGGKGKLYKQFLDHLAYVCDSSMGGDTVTAIAIEGGPQLKYWVAANSGRPGKSIEHIRTILGSLKEVSKPGASENTILAIKNKICNRIIEFSRDRLKSYRNKLSLTVGLCLKGHLGRENTKDAKALRSWLASVLDENLSMDALVHQCYGAQSSGIYRILDAMTQRAKSPRLPWQARPDSGEYSEIRRLIGRLSAHIKSARVFVEAGRYCPELFTNYSVEPAKCYSPTDPPSYQSDSSINKIIKRMKISHPACYDRHLDGARSRDENFILNLQNCVREKYETPEFKLRMHAEIVILDFFDQGNLSFLGGIPYIGVSKPSCLLCYRYIQAHPLGARTSGCSNNLYLQWRPPYIQDTSPLAVQKQEAIMNKMAQEIRGLISDLIVPGYKGQPPHPDSIADNESVRSFGSIRKLPSLSHTKRPLRQGLHPLHYASILPERPPNYGSVDGCRPAHCIPDDALIEAQNLVSETTQHPAPDAYRDLYLVDSRLYVSPRTCVEPEDRVSRLQCTVSLSPKG
ncbi:hypothetical protein TWF718_009335 [Orbilia javanica]|uniref:Uncharacterized protein n=1 Tax=Orbilia javanica TaxID=47235 RepID=A0AAN8MVV4_9PEZI